eukprot:1844447-Pyramimonas_sp.AAC.1
MGQDVLLVQIVSLLDADVALNLAGAHTEQEATTLPPWPLDRPQGLRRTPGKFAFLDARQVGVGVRLCMVLEKVGNNIVH